jgi:hypothetical protein
MRVFVTSLSAYNAGELRGEWLSLPADSEELNGVIARYTNNGSNDYFLSDFESDIIPVNENNDICTLNEQAAA